MEEKPENVLKPDFRSKQNDLHEIESGLFLGNIQAAYDSNRLIQLNIKNLLTIDLYPICNKVDPTFKIKFIRLVDNDRADILHHFEECIEFLETILAKNEKVLVHCHAGVSRSATIVCAYLMKKHGKSVKKALASIRNKRDVSPNRGFMFQLELFHRMDYKIDPTFKGYKKYRLKYASSQVMKARILPLECMDVVKPDPGLEQTNPDPSVYRCRRCRRIVASRNNLMTHTIKSKHMNLNQSSNVTKQSVTTDNLDKLPNIMKSCTLSSDKSLDRSSDIEVCDKIYFVEPLDWMNVAKDVQGCLKCPKCSSKLGNFHWTEACICPCGAKVSPAFYFVPSKVEFSNVVKNIQVTV